MCRRSAYDGRGGRAKQRSRLISGAYNTLQDGGKKRRRIGRFLHGEENGSITGSDRDLQGNACCVVNQYVFFTSLHILSCYVWWHFASILIKP